MYKIIWPSLFPVLIYGYTLVDAQSKLAVKCLNNAIMGVTGGLAMEHWSEDRNSPTTQASANGLFDLLYLSPM